MASLKRPGGAAAKKNTTGRCFFFAAAPRGRSLTHCGPGWCLPLAGVVFFFLLRPRPDRGGVFFFCCGPARTLTHSLWAGAISARFGWCFFFCCGPARSFLVSLKRPGGAAAKKTPRGGVFFFAAAPRGRSLTHCGPGWCLPLAGVVFFFLLRPRPDRGGVFFCCGPAQTLTHSLWAGAISARFGWCFFFLLWPRPVFLGNSKKCLVYYIGSKKTPRATTKKKNKKKNTTGRCFFFCCGPARTLTHSLRAWVVPPPRRGGVFFLLRPRPDRCGVFFFCCGPAQTLTHSLWAGAISARFGWCFFFCCGPAGSFLVSLKRPGGAAAKKNTTGRCFFFAAAPRGRSLTHCGPGWCLPLAGVVFFFLPAAPPGPGWCFFFCCGPRPDAHSLTVGWGDFGKVRVVFFFCCGPARSF